MSLPAALVRFGISVCKHVPGVANFRKCGIGFDCVHGCEDRTHPPVDLTGVTFFGAVALRLVSPT
jgi:hypothetical protein